MKTIILILLPFLCSYSYGQTRPTTGISCAVYHTDGVCDYGKLFGSLNSFTLPVGTQSKLKDFISTDTIRFITVNTKPLIVLKTEKNGEYEFQIDKSKICKGIIWTSDSTFILKRNP